jgi:hypothetical protein
MSLVPQQHRIDPFGRFEVVYEAGGRPDRVSLHSASDGEPATLAFYEAWAQLTRDQVAGHLLLLYHDEGTRTLLREPVGLAL